MIKLPENMLGSDVEQWLWNTWFWDAGEGRPLRFQHVEDSSTIAASTLGGTMVLIDKEDVRAHWPACGAINVNEIALYVQRNQVRQYRRSYTSDFVDVEVPRKWDLMKKGCRTRHLTGETAEVVEQLFNPEYPTLEDAVSELTRGEAHARALNRHVMLVGQADKILVYYGGPHNLVGRLQENTLIPSVAGRKYALRVSKLIGATYRGRD